jgi:hypothetical protein
MKDKIGQTKNEYKILVGKPQRDHWGDLAVDWKTILN